MRVYVVEGFRFPFEDKHLVNAVRQTAESLELYPVVDQPRPSRSHWHLKREGRTGTLKVTWDDDANRLLVIVHQNCAGEKRWAEKLAPKFAAQVACTLNGEVANNHVTHRN